LDSSDDILTSDEAGGRVIRGSAIRTIGSVAGIVVGLATAALLLRYLGVAESGRYITVMSLLAIASSVTDAGLNITGSSALALRAPRDRPVLLANLVGQRMLVTPFVLLVVVLFTVLVGYPQRMVLGAVLAGVGLFMVSVADAALLPLTVELRNGGLAIVDFLKQAVTLVGVALLVILGASLAPFFAVQIVVGIFVVILAMLLAGARALLSPRLDRQEQRAMLTRALPLAAAFVLGQVYFRLVIVLMSLISSPQQTGYFGGSLRAMEALVTLPILVAGVALPVLAAAARDDLARLRYAIKGLSEGAVVAGVLVVIVTIRAAEPVMAIIGGPAFRPAGAVLRIQVGALLFIALYQIWTVSLVALSRQRELIATNFLALLGVAVFAVVLVPQFGAEGGAAASVLGDALLASLIYWRLSRSTGNVAVPLGFLGRVAVAAAAAAAVLILPGIPDLVDAALASAVFLGAGWAVGMLRQEVREALALRRVLWWR